MKILIEIIALIIGGSLMILGIDNCEYAVTKARKTTGTIQFLLGLVIFSVSIFVLALTINGYL